MSWTVVDDGDMLNVRAVIDSKTEQHEIAALIAALEKRLNIKESGSNGPADVGF